MRASIRLALLALPAAVLAACDASSNNGPTNIPAALQLAAGGSQAGIVATALANPVVVTVVDAGGNPVPNVAVSFSTASGSGSVSGSTLTTDKAGQASVTWTLGTLAGTDTLTALVSNGTIALTQVITATAGAGLPANVVIVSGANQAAAAGSALPAPIVAQVVDAYGNPVANATVTWSVAAGSVANATTTTDANGLTSNIVTLGPSSGADPVSIVVNVPAGASAVAATVGENAQ